MIIIGISKFSWDKLKSAKLFRFLKKHNFVMYLFHQQLIYIVISLFNSKVGTIPLALMNILVSVLGSALISVLLSKIPIVNKILGYR